MGVTSTERVKQGEPEENKIGRRDVCPKWKRNPNNHWGKSLIETTQKQLD